MSHIEKALLEFKSQFYSEIFDNVQAEIHITYNLTTIDMIERFKAVCDSKNIKIVGVEFQNIDGITEYQFMTSVVAQYPLRTIYDVMVQITNKLSDFEATRLKVEVNYSTMPERIKKAIQYYELHLLCDTSDVLKRNIILSYINDLNYKVSQNITGFKPIDSCMLTKRYPHHDETTINEYQYLIDASVTENKMEIEAIIFDSNVAIDVDW